MACYFKNDKNKWSVSFYCKNHLGVNKKYKKSGFNTKTEAIKYYNDFIALKSGSNDIVFINAFNEFKKYNDINLKYNTKLLYNQLDTEILKYFQNSIVNEIDERTILKFIMNYNHIPTKQKKILNRLKTFFDYCVIYFNLNNNVVNKIKLNNRVEKKEKQIITLEEFNLFDEFLKKYQLHHRVYFNLLYFSGARAGEISGLKYKDIDFNNSSIDINKTRLTKKETNTTKSKTSKRVISINKRCLEMLKMLYNAYPLKNKDDVFIFKHQNTYNNILKQYNFNKNITLHCFRHSHTSFLIDKNVNIELISKRLGHSNINITMAIYSHLYNTEDKTIDNILNNL